LVLHPIPKLATCEPSPAHKWAKVEPVHALALIRPRRFRPFASTVKAALVLGLSSVVASVAVAKSDCNENGSDDAADIASGASRDCNADSVPDECGVSVATFRAGISLDEPNSTSDLALVDVDGDDKLDIVTTHFSSGMVAVRRGSGDRDFAPPERFPVGRDPRSFATGDFDGNGTLDIVAAVASVESIAAIASFLPGKGDGTFDRPREIRGTRRHNTIAAADIDGDGDLDFALAGNELSILLGRGDGTFAAGEVLVLSSESRRVVAVDVDGDGHTDLVSAHPGSQEIVILRGRGDGSFGAVEPISVTAPPLDVFAGDVDGDGDLDLVLPLRGLPEIAIYRASSPGTFAAAEHIGVARELERVRLVDVDGDDRLDVAGVGFESQNLVILSGRSDGTLAPPRFFAAGPCSCPTNPSGVHGGLSC
jgi:hypothetical protein